MRNPFEITDAGSIIIITPVTQEAEEAMQAHLDTEPWQWMGSGLCVDRRVAGGVLEHLYGVLGMVEE